jgi:hypothetical protein
LAFQKLEQEGHEGNEEHEGLRDWEPFVVLEWILLVGGLS